MNNLKFSFFFVIINLPVKFLLKSKMKKNLLH